MPKTATTGEIAISEQKVLGVGGAKSKLNAAWEAGVENIVFPRTNFNIKGSPPDLKSFRGENETFPNRKAVMHYLVENISDLKEVFQTLTS